MMKKNILSCIDESCPWQDSVHFYESIDSTNTQAKHMAAEGAPEGTILIADQQTGGRGRLGRTFLSPAGTGVYLSLILRPCCPPADLMHLTCAAAVAMCEAVEKSTGIKAEIKWTNDVVFGHRKLAGILTELGLDPKTGLVSYAVVGIGVNCCQKEENLPTEIRSMAASLSMVTGKSVDRNRVAGEMINSLWRMSRILLTEKKQIMNRYRARCITLGQDVSVVRADGAVRYGRAEDLDDDGGLIVFFRDGTSETVSSGEVSVRGMYGYV